MVPFLKVVNDTAVAVNQGGKRKGAVCAYLETWHLDIEEFVELRKNTGDDRRRTHDMNTANWVPDLFMERVFEGKSGPSSLQMRHLNCMIFLGKPSEKSMRNMKSLLRKESLKPIKKWKRKNYGEKYCPCF